MEHYGTFSRFVLISRRDMILMCHISKNNVERALQKKKQQQNKENVIVREGVKERL